MANAQNKKSLYDGLKAIGTAGLSGVTVSATSTLSALAELLEGTSSVQSIPRLLAELRRQDLVIISKHPRSIHLQLSVKGIHRLQRLEIEQMNIDQNQRWDGMWRMVMFDVPAHLTRERSLFRRELKRLGFTMVQRSIWMHPYPCFDAVASLISYCNLQRHVSIAEVGRIDEVTLKRLLRSYPDLNS